MKKRKRETINDKERERHQEEDNPVSFSDYTSTIWRIDTTNIIHPFFFIANN